MSIAEYIEVSIFRKNGFWTTLIMGPLLLGYLLLYPNLILHATEFSKTYIKYPLMASLFLITFVLGVRAIVNYWFFMIVLALLVFNYIYVQTHPLSQFPMQAVLFLLLAGMYYRHPNFIGLYFKASIFVSIIFSLQTIIVFFCWLGEVLGLGTAIHVQSWIFQGESQARVINLFLGSNGWVNVAWWAGFRASSYFSEAARFAYFLTPFLYVTAYLRGRSLYYSAAFYLISLSIILTFSVAAFASIAITYFLWRYGTLSKKIKFLFLLVCILIPIFFISYVANQELWDTIFYKGQSAHTRILAFNILMKMIGMHLTGCDMINPLCVKVIAKVTWAPLFWLLFSGVQGFCFMLLMLLYFGYVLLYLINTGGEFERALGYGGVAVLLEQTWWGNYLEFPFIGYFAILIAVVAIRRKLKKKYGVTGKNGEFGNE